jgi:rhodanese-related sulfurtransferase
MSKSILAGIVFAALIGIAGTSHAVDAASVPDAKRTAQGFYLTADEVPPFLASHKGRTLFVDVRTPEELAASGVADAVDANAPLVVMSADGNRRPNPDFVTTVSNRLADMGLTKADPIVLICHTGRRSAMAANLLAQAGYANVYSVVVGFEGDGPQARGWKNSGLPVRPANSRRSA